MECTIGWIKTKKRIILFKNRDTKKEFINTNIFYKNDKISCITYTNTNRKGCWIGINRYGIGFASAKGPCRKIPKDYSSWEKFNEIGEVVLKEAKSLDEAKDIFIQFYKKDKIGESANILLCDRIKACLLEFCLEKIDIKTYSDFVFRTNHFSSLREFNSDFKFLPISQVRLDEFEDLFKRIKEISGEYLVSLLTHHSENEDESICRHGNIMTVGSGIFELANRNLIVYYNLNRTPCNGKFKKEMIKN